MSTTHSEMRSFMLLSDELKIGGRYDGTSTCSGGRLLLTSLDVHSESSWAGGSGELTMLLPSSLLTSVQTKCVVGR
jgi:hypothetical protein